MPAGPGCFVPVKPSARQIKRQVNRVPGEPLGNWSEGRRSTLNERRAASIHFNFESFYIIVFNCKFLSSVYPGPVMGRVMLMQPIRDAGAIAPGLNLFSRQLQLSAGALDVVAGAQTVGPMRRGLKIGVLLDGGVSLTLDDQPTLQIRGAALFIAANAGNRVQQRAGLSAGVMRYALTQFAPDFVVNEFGGQAAGLLEAAGPDDARVWIRPAGPAVRSVALQMVACPVSAPLRRLYLAGKALELATLALDEIGRGDAGGRSRLSRRTREQVLAARDMLLADMQQPPGLPELAHACGLNPTRLTSAFRTEFGMSVFAYLQEQRLLRAHAMIASGEVSVASAAFHVGYTPAYFSVLFQKRFGISPGKLR